jgi:hypothetical protein
MRDSDKQFLSAMETTYGGAFSQADREWFLKQFERYEVIARVCGAPEGATILVASHDLLEVAQRAAARHKPPRTDLKFAVNPGMFVVGGG